MVCCSDWAFHTVEAIGIASVVKQVILPCSKSSWNISGTRMVWKQRPTFGWFRCPPLQHRKFVNKSAKSEPERFQVWQEALKCLAPSMPNFGKKVNILNHWPNPSKNFLFHTFYGIQISNKSGWRLKNDSINTKITEDCTHPDFITITSNGVSIIVIPSLQE
jgi:hypothetical protein